MVLAGLIYQRGKRLPHADIAKAVNRLKRIAKALRWYGAGIMIFGLAGIVWVWGPLLISNFKFQILNQFQKSQVQISKQNIETPSWEVPDTNYSIYIPKIGAISRVISNVDAGNKKEYLAALKLGVAEAKGLAHPGETGTTFLFAHSVASPLDYARYNAVFYLLDKLVVGDNIEVVYRNKLLKYQVTSVQRLASSDTNYLRPQEDEELLVLQTCWPAGTRQKRLVLTARPVMVY